MPYDGSKDPDAGLVAEARSGNMAAVSRIMESYQKRVFGICYRMVGNYEDAADLTQEALIRVLTNLHRFDGRAAFSTWVIRITMNVSLSHRRKERRRRETFLPTGGGGRRTGGRGDGREELRNAAEPAQIREPGASSSVEHGEKSRNLAACLEEVGDEYRALLVLRDIQGLEYGQIADVLGLPIGTVKSRLFRARMAFRKRLERRERESEISPRDSLNPAESTTIAAQPGGA